MPATLTGAWSLTGTVATARAGSAGARLDLAVPAFGLAVAGGDGEDHLLGIALGAPAGPPADHWARGGDLTAVYEPDDARRLRATAMWRVHPAAVAAWELVVSAQTSLLHAEATLAVVSDLCGGTVRWSAAAAGCRWAPVRGPLPGEAAALLVVRGATGALVAVHPQDPRSIGVTMEGNRARIECDIFPAAIEKGVILRSRVLAAIGPAADAERWASELAAAFAAAPPFLDT